MSCTDLFLYAVEREGYDDPYHTEHYLDETTAKNRIISFAVKTRCIACAYVYRIDLNALDKKLQLTHTIELATDESKRFYKIWLKQDAEELSEKYILENPEIMYDCLQHTMFN